MLLGSMLCRLTPILSNEDRPSGDDIINVVYFQYLTMPVEPFCRLRQVLEGQKVAITFKRSWKPRKV